MAAARRQPCPSSWRQAVELARPESVVLTALIAIAIGPGLFLMHRAYAADLHEPEPVPHVFWYSVVGGSCSFWLALTIGLVVGPAIGFAFQVPIRSLPGQTLAIFLCVALVEELMK